MKPRWHLWWRIVVAATDALFVSAALAAVAVARFGTEALTNGFDPSTGGFFAQAPLLYATPVWMLVFTGARLYSPKRCQNALEEGRRLVTAGLGAAVALVMLGFLIKENPARSWLFGGMVLGTLSAATGRRTVRSVIARMREKGRWMTPTVVVGRRQAKAVVEHLLADPATGVLPVGVCGFDWPGVPTWTVSDVRAAIESSGAGEVLVVAEDLERHEIAASIEVADDLPVHLVLLPGIDHLLLGSLHLVTVGHEPGLAVEPPSLHGYQAFIKRVIDMAVSAVLLVLSAPIMLIAAIAIAIDSRGPIIFKQQRVGRGGATFDVVKFRTMDSRVDPNAPDIDPDSTDLGFLSKPANDPRVTRIGRFLRRTSIDELPQLWNVLRGEMSLVGPRPLPVWEAAAVDVRRRLVVRPGLTGLWQVSGRSAVAPDERIRLDLVYVQNWNLLLDLSILLRTAPAIVGRRGAY